jgi:hypothetical protein
MPWYSTQQVDGVAVLHLKGDAKARVYQWLGGLDGLFLRGQRQVVVSLERVTIAAEADAGFVRVLAHHVARIDGEVVFVGPTDARSARVLWRAGPGRRLPFATTVEDAVRQLSLPMEHLVVTNESAGLRD